MFAPTMRRWLRSFAAACCCLAVFSFAPGSAQANPQVQVNVPSSFQVDFGLQFTLAQIAAADPTAVVFTTTDPLQIMALAGFGLTSPVTLQQLNTAFPMAVVNVDTITFVGVFDNSGTQTFQFSVQPACVTQTAIDCVAHIDYSGFGPAGLNQVLGLAGNVGSVTITGAGALGPFVGLIEPAVATELSQFILGGFAVDVLQGAQSITFGAPPTVTVGTTGTVSATGGASMNPVTFTSTTPTICSVSGTTVTGLAGGTCTIAANQAGNADFAAAPQVTQSFTIGAFTGARLGNISTRMQVLTGNNVLIAGFIIGGSAPKTVAITATGPSLVPFGITDPLANPTLTLVRQSDHVVIASNDDWQTDVNAAQLNASGFAPTNPLEAGLFITLPPGAYTAIVSGVGGGTGVSVAGVFEIDHPEIPLINISTRGEVLTGNDVMIAGLIVAGTAPQKVAITATGPSLVPFGITNPLANPTLTLVRQSDHAVIATNDDWQTDPNASQLLASGFAPTNPLESGLVVTLPPGAYTAIVSGAGGGVGVSVVGVFTLP